MRKRVDELLKAKVTPALKDKYSKKEYVLRQQIESLTETIVYKTSRPDEFEPLPKVRAKHF